MAITPIKGKETQMTWEDQNPDSWEVYLQET